MFTWVLKKFFQLLVGIYTCVLHVCTWATARVTGPLLRNYGFLNF